MKDRLACRDDFQKVVSYRLPTPVEKNNFSKMGKGVLISKLVMPVTANFSTTESSCQSPPKKIEARNFLGEGLND